jgi:hypothetical protein
MKVTLFLSGSEAAMKQDIGSCLANGCPPVVFLHETRRPTGFLWQGSAEEYGAGRKDPVAVKKKENSHFFHIFSTVS